VVDSQLDIQWRTPPPQTRVVVEIQYAYRFSFIIASFADCPQIMCYPPR
jgi:hypothetical protein